MQIKLNYVILLTMQRIYVSFIWKEDFFEIRITDFSADCGSPFRSHSFQETERHTYWVVRFTRPSRSIHLLS